MKKLFLFIVFFCFFGAAVSGIRTDAADTVNNAVVKKTGKYYTGFMKNGYRIRNKWGCVRTQKKTYKYYFDKKGRAYTGVCAIGKSPADTKLYYFTSRGRLDRSRTAKLQKLSKAGKKYVSLKKYIARIDKKTSCMTETACGMKMSVYSTGFTVYMDVEDEKRIGYILSDRQ